MYILAMMSNVIYFNIFTIKHEMGQASLVCAVARSGGGAGGGWERVLKLEGKVAGTGRTEVSLRVERRIGWSGREKRKDEATEEGQASKG